MLDQIIDNIIQKIRQEVVQPGMNDIPLMYVLTRDIPHSVKHFFDQEVEIWIREESQTISSSERFDYEIPEVQMLLDKVFDTLKQSATFHINQFNRLLERAIKLQANYLIRPQQTLTQFLFKDSSVITTIEVYDMLKYFDKFQYYKDALTDYFNLKYLREISQNQFEELISAIDKQVFSENPVETALQTVKNVNNFINEGRTSPSELMRTKILAIIFKDRNLDEFSKLIEQEIRNGNTEIAIADLENVLRTGKSLQELEAAAIQDSITLDTIPDIEEEKPAVSVESIEVPETIAPPEPQVFEEEEYEEEEYEEEYEEEEQTPEPATMQSQPAGQQDAGGSVVDQLADLVGDKMKGEEIEDLNRLIMPKQRKRFIKKIFMKQEQQYLEFINLVNSTPTWKHASNLIDSFFYQQGLNPYSREALEFSDLVYNRYFPKDISVNKGQEFRS